MERVLYSSEVSDKEIAFVRDWTTELTGSSSRGDWKLHTDTGMPVSFKYGSDNGKEILDQSGWKCQSQEWKDKKRLHTLTSTDSNTGLQCTIEITEFEDYPAVEWLTHFTNTSDRDTPAISEVMAIDMMWKCPGVIPVLHHSRGSDERPDDFEYMSEVMSQIRMPSRTLHYNSGAGSNPFTTKSDGRSSVEWLPFFNLQTDTDGIVIAIGWSGQWAADFEHDGNGNTHIRAGMEFMDLKLLPGETIRTPKMLVLYYEGKPIHGENVLRRFLLNYHTPQVNGKPAVPPFPHATWGGASTAEHLEMIEKISKHGLLYDYCWIDAGWYGSGSEISTDVFNGDWGITGDWHANPYRHPNGLRPIRDAARKAGMKTVLWVEPLRATNGTPVTLEHPEWFLNPSGESPLPGQELLLNLADPEACQWAIDTVSRLVDEFGIDIYEEDFNYWLIQECFERKDPPGRRGITEIRFMEGQYRFWDELVNRHPGLLIGNCASGGRRIDLETMTRSLALWRSDYNCFPVNHDYLQLHTVGISHWIPINGTSPVAEPNDTYAFRSALAPTNMLLLDEVGRLKRPEFDEATWAWYRRMIGDYMRMRPYWYGDFYPLLGCSMNLDSWMAYQLHHREMDEGVVAVYRRPQSPMTSASFELRGLTEGAVYEFEDADSGEKQQIAANEIEKSGFEVRISTPRTAKLIFYRKI